MCIRDSMKVWLKSHPKVLAGIGSAIAAAVGGYLAPESTQDILTSIATLLGLL